MEITYSRVLKQIGEENYRMAVCILFSNKAMSHDIKHLKKLAQKYNASLEMLYPKIDAMMISKCYKALPSNFTKKVTATMLSVIVGIKEGLQELRRICFPKLHRVSRWKDQLEIERRREKANEHHRRTTSKG